MINVSQQTFSRIENGETSLPADILVDLSKMERNMDLFRAYGRLNRTNQELVFFLMGQMEKLQDENRQKAEQE